MIFGMRSGALVVLLFACQACGPSLPASAVPSRADSRSAPLERRPSRLTILEGELVTFRTGTVLGVEKYRDDGDRITSDVSLGPQQHSIALSRVQRTVTCDDKAPIALNDHTVALENGHWQAYAVAAERFRDASAPQAVTVLLPCSGTTIEGFITVTRAKAGHLVVLRVGSLSSEVLIDERGTVAAGMVPQQALEVRRAGDDAPQLPQALPTPEGVIETELSAIRDGVALRGTLWVPRDAPRPTPVALIIAGSGPTDRDGNNALGIRSDAYRLLAAEVAAHGIATVRYDKRGVGRSGNTQTGKPLVIDDFVQDAVSWIELVRNDPRLGKLTLIGHSEGGLVAILTAQRAPIDALVLVACFGRPLDKVLRAQLARQLPTTVLNEYDRIVAALHAGRPIEPVPEELSMLFQPALRSFSKSVFALDPATELKKVPRIPTSIVQGQSDLQVSVHEANALAAVVHGVRLQIIPRMNHVLKEELDLSQPQMSYTDPTRPLAPGLVSAVIAGTAR